MRKIYLVLCFVYSSSIFSSTSLDERIDFILDSELGEEVTNTIIESSMESLSYSGMTAEELDEVNKITEPYLETYIKDIKRNVRILYKETFTEDEINAYYNFLNSKSGRSFKSKMPQFSIDMMGMVFSTLTDLLSQMELDPEVNTMIEQDLYVNPLMADNMADIENNNSCLYCDLSFQSLRDRNLDGVNLSGSRLQSADFTNSSLIGANFSDTNLVDTNFTGANLENSNFTNAVIESADFRLTTVKIIDLEDASYICNVKLSGGIENIDC